MSVVFSFHFSTNLLFFLYNNYLIAVYLFILYYIYNIYIYNIQSKSHPHTFKRWQLTNSDKSVCVSLQDSSVFKKNVVRCISQVLNFMLKTNKSPVKGNQVFGNEKTYYRTKMKYRLLNTAGSAFKVHYHFSYFQQFQKPKRMNMLIFYLNLSLFFTIAARQLDL